MLVAMTALVMAIGSLTGCVQRIGADGFIDHSGKLVMDASKITPKPLAIGDYCEGLAPLRFEAGSGCLDKNGKIVFILPFVSISQFSEGMAAVRSGNGSGAKWGFIDIDGKTIIEPRYRTVGRFSENCAPVLLVSADAGPGSSGKWCFIDKSGKIILDQLYEQAEPFSEGLATVKKKGKFGCINRLGTVVVPFAYDVVYPCKNGIVVAAQGTGCDDRDQTLDYFDKLGKHLSQKVIKPVTLRNLQTSLWMTDRFDHGKDSPDRLSRSRNAFVTPGFSEGHAIVQVGEKFGFIKAVNFDSASAEIFDYVFPYSSGSFVCYSDNDGGKFDYIDSAVSFSGRAIPKTFRFYDAAPLSEGVGLVQEFKDGLFGFVDGKGNYVIPPLFNHARSFKDGRALVGDSALLVP
jgi:hypothetical protein